MEVWRSAVRGGILALGLLLVGGCGDGSVCIEGVPCGPVPTFYEPMPGPVQGAERFRAAGLGNWHACMLDSAGAAWCWGSNEYGQLGAASTQRCMDGNVDCSPVPLRVGGGRSYTALAAGHVQTCALAVDGSAWCWGNGPQLGDGVNQRSLLPVAVADGHRYTQLSSSQHGALTCGLQADGSPWCWGTGFNYGTTGPDASATPVRWAAAATLAWTSLSLGAAYACGLDSAGQAWGIGNNAYGQLGDGGSASSRVPVPVAGGRRYVAVAAGASHSCALEASGQAWYWGTCGTATCGITLDGAARCWGWNEVGGTGRPIVAY